MFEDNLKGIATFLTVVESGSFAAAATRINVTRSAVAKSIGRLEGRLGVRLFQRTTRQQKLTDEGRQYYEQCSRLMTELRDVESALDKRKRGLEGRIRLSAPILFGRRCVAPVLRSLIRAHPQLDLQAAVYSHEDRIRAVQLYLKLGKRIRASIRQLGYPTKNSLKA